MEVIVKPAMLEEAELKKFPEYYTPTALEMVVGLTVNDLYAKSSRGPTAPYFGFFGWCSDTLTGRFSGWRVYVGNLNEFGLMTAAFEDRANRNLGRAALRTI